MRVQYSIPDALESQIRALASEAGITPSTLVVAAVRQWLRSGAPLVLIPASPPLEAEPEPVSRSAAALTQKRGDTGSLVTDEGDFWVCQGCLTEVQPENVHNRMHVGCSAGGATG